jgi:hypothetical protein
VLDIFCNSQQTVGEPSDRYGYNYLSATARITMIILVK